MEISTENLDTEIPAGTATWWHYLLVVAAVAFVLLPDLGGNSLDGHEVHVGLVARSMLDRQSWISPEILANPPPNTLANHWLVPVENGNPRLNKTPLMYWCAAGLSRLTGLSPASVRGSSVIAAALMALTVLGLGRRMFNPRVALMGAMILVTCMGFVKIGRNARPEMLMACLATMAMAAFYMALNEPRPWRHAAWMLAAWVAMGLSNLAKEFVPVLLLWPLATYVMWRSLHHADEQKARRVLAEFFLLAVGLVIIYALLMGRAWMPKGAVTGKVGLALVFVTPLAWVVWRSRPWRGIARLLPTAVPGAILMGALFIPWLLHMKNLFPEMAARVYANELTDRVAATGNWGFGSAYRTLQSVFDMTAPWCVLLPMAVAAVWLKRFRRHREPLVFLLVWVGGLTLILTTVAVKRMHYMLPGIPAACMLLGYVLADGAYENRFLKASLMRWCGVAAGAAGPVILAVLVVLAWRRQWSPEWVGLVYVAAAGMIPWVLSGVLAWRRNLAASTGLLIAAMLITGAGLALIAPDWNIDKPYRDFALQARTIIPPGDPVWWWDKDSGVGTYYFGRDILLMQWRRGAWATLSADGKAAARRQFDEWVRGPQRPQWVIVRVEEEGEIPHDRYRLALSSRDDHDPENACLLYRRSD